MPTFVQRTTAPTKDNAYYYANNPFYKSGWGMPNCTCYAWGRFYEITGTYPKLSTANAENWWGYSDGYARGQTPKRGAVMCWRKGVAGDGDDGAGHVAIVEAVHSDGSITTSESGWNDSRFWWENTRTNSNGRWGSGSAYTFQGFIYSPIDFDAESTPVEPITGNRYLSKAEMENNARYIWQYLKGNGWSMNAVAGMLGNMQTESTINPGIWESLDEGDTSQGFGLVQWTPATKLITWANSQYLDYTEMDTQLERIEYELAKGLQYYPTDSYPETFAQFKVSTKSPNYLGMAFLANYERPAEPNQPARGTQAEAWYKFLQSIDSDTPVIPDDPNNPGTYVPRKRMSLLLLMATATRRRK